MLSAKYYEFFGAEKGASCDGEPGAARGIFLSRYLKIGGLDLLLPFLIILVVTVQLPGFADDPGTGWHLMTGREVVENGVPKVDPFLAGPKRPWIADQWLADVFLNGVFSLGGWELLYGILIGVFCGTFFLLLYASLALEGVSPVYAALSSFFVFKISLIHFLARPSLFGFLLFSVLVGFLRLRRQDTPLHWKEVALTFLLFALWSNVHPSFILGLAMLCTWFGVAFLESLQLRDERWRVAGVRLVALTCSGLLGSLLNPYHISLYRSVLALGGSTYFMRLHEEWMSPDFAELPGQLVCVMIAVLVIAHRADLLPRIRWQELAVILVFTASALHSVRILPYAGIVLAAPFSRAMEAIVKKVVSVSGSSSLAYIREEKWLFRGGVWGTIFVLCALVTSAFSFGSLPFYSGTFGPSPARYPVGAIEFLLKAQSDGVARVFAPPRWGGFITFAGAGSLKAVVDDRNQLLGEHFMRRTYTALSSGNGLSDLLSEVEADYVLLPRGGLVERQLREGSLPLYLDEVAVVYSRKD